jgi:hypothetical protein
MAALFKFLSVATPRKRRGENKGSQKRSSKAASGRTGEVDQLIRRLLDEPVSSTQGLTELSIGSFDEHYDLLHELGRGAFARVRVPTSRRC